MNAALLLLNPPSPSSATADREAMYGMGAIRPHYARPQPPHTLAWCGGQLQKGGWDVYGLDAVAEGLDEKAIFERMVPLQPRIVIMLTSPQTAEQDYRFLQKLTQRYSLVRVLLVGQGARFLPSRLTQFAHLTLLGEPEGAIEVACRTLLNPDGERGATQPHLLNPDAYDERGFLVDLSYLAPPAWELFPVSRYLTLPIVSARGCNYGCRYCPAPKTQGSLRTRLPERVVAEMQLMVNRHNIRSFYFVDPLFAAERAHVIALCRAIERRGLETLVGWQCESRPERLDVALIRRMAQAGCTGIHLGVESVSPQILTSTGRLADKSEVSSYLDQVRQIVLACRAYGVDCWLYTMAGLPGDKAGAHATRAFVRAYAPHSGQVSILTPYTGTSIFPTAALRDEWELLQATLPTENATPAPPRWATLLPAMRFLS